VSAVSSWVLTIVGVIIITVIVEITMPDGNINKYIKGILVIFTVFVMVSPITNLNIFGSIKNSDYDIKLDDSYLGDVNSQIANEYKVIIESKLKTNGYENVTVDIDLKDDEKLEIDAVFVYLCDLVLKSNDESINIYNNIKSIIKSVVVVDAEDIIFYE